ncbi:MAG: alpha-L-fucosidase [Dysgonamonadaceae bacterium]|nr:alpha-L-fucosidase [Dysgonamonadaceae bacterium]
MNKKIIIPLVICFFILFTSYAQQNENKPEVVQNFMDMGFGMFIHWSMDSQLGMVISHSMAGASDKYLDRYINELPKTFNPKKFDPHNWALLAKLAGMKYVVFTAKHHSGFCMFDTGTTTFNIMNTPFERDITKEVIEAFRKEGLAIGLYFSPEDFHYLYKANLPVGRLQHPMHYPENNPGLMELDKAQLKELLSNYGKIDMIFFDGPANGLKELAWELQPDIMVTRGEIETPEQEMPNKPLPGPWEACYTMGTDWQYKPTNDPHKSGTEIINMLIEIRAKGGNFLLNVGPKPDGEIQIEQENLLREIGLWNFINSEAIYGTRPWNIIKEDNIWYTASPENKTVYAFITRTNWQWGERDTFVLSKVKGNDETIVSILGYNSELVEYRQDFDASIYWEQTSTGLLISAVNGHRLYTNNKWPNPVVLKIENATQVKEEIEEVILVSPQKQNKVEGAK